MPRRILIVEDDDASRDLVASILTEAGYETLEAERGASALVQAQGEQPDLVLLDLMMPGLDGFEVCRRLKRDPCTARIPVIVLTAMGKAMDMDSAVSSGADDFVTKPIEPANLRTRVAAMLKVVSFAAGRDRREAYVQELQRARERGRTLSPAGGSLPSRPAPGQPMRSVLLVHSDRGQLRRYTGLLTSQDLLVRTVQGDEEALTLLQQHQVQAVVLGPQLREGTALDLLQVLRIRYPEMPVILVAAQSDPRAAVRAMKMGAADVLLEDEATDELLPAIQRLLRPGNLLSGADAGASSLS